MDKGSTQDIKDVSCETTKDYTRTQDEYTISCIAQSTKENSEEMRKYNLSQLLAELSLNETVKDDYEIVAYNAVDSLTLHSTKVQHGESENLV